MTKQAVEAAVARIREMEACFDLLQAMAAQHPEAARKPFFQALLGRLTRYYEGGQWLRDYRLDEQGLLPADLKRGVLSEDGVYDFLASIQT
jgi:hypothetical protein